jgi:hypothetical protein
VHGTGVSEPANDKAEHIEDEREADGSSLVERNITTKLFFIWKWGRPDIHTEITGVIEEVNAVFDTDKVTIRKKLVDEHVDGLFKEAVNDMDKMVTMTPVADNYIIPGKMLVRMDDYIRDLIKKAVKDTEERAVAARHQWKTATMTTGSDESLSAHDELQSLTLHLTKMMPQGCSHLERGQ